MSIPEEANICMLKFFHILAFFIGTWKILTKYLTEVEGEAARRRVVALSCSCQTTPDSANKDYDKTVTNVQTFTRHDSSLDFSSLYNLYCVKS